LAVLRFVREQSQERLDFLFDGDEESTRFVASLEQAVLAWQPKKAQGPSGSPPGGPMLTMGRRNVPERGQCLNRKNQR
jgi:hypothetical protein